MLWLLPILSLLHTTSQCKILPHIFSVENIPRSEIYCAEVGVFKFFKALPGLYNFCLDQSSRIQPQTDGFFGVGELRGYGDGWYSEGVFGSVFAFQQVNAFSDCDLTQGPIAGASCELPSGSSPILFLPSISLIQP